FNSPIIKNLNRRVKNQGYYYSLDSINSAYIANILDGLYEARNESISKFKKEAKDKNVKASALVMANNIDLDAKGNISLAGSVVADNVNLNSQNLNLNHLELNSKDLNLKADAANINSSEISAKNINVNANNISLDKESSQFSKASNLKADESLSLNAKENLNITGGGLEADKINLNADNVNINAKEFAYSHSAKEKGISFKQSIQTLNSANLDAKDINLNSKSNTNISSSNLRATNKLNVEAGNDIYVVGANTNESTETKEKSKGFFSKKESQLMAINQKVISSNLNAGDISLKAGGNAIVTGSNLSAKNDINIDANNISINPSAYESLEYSQTNKRGFGGLKRSIDMHYLSNLNLISSSLLTNSGKINLNANKDISIISSNINSASTINLNALNTVSILAAKEQSKEMALHKSSTFNPLGILTYVATLGTSGGKIYSAKHNEQGTLDGISKLSNISAKDNINLNTSDATITANLSSDKNIEIKANQTTILNATNTHESYSISKSKSISIARLQDILKDIKPKSLSELKKDTSIKLRVADAKYKEATNNTSSLNSISSTLNANNINIDTNYDISIKGSNLNAKEDISLISKNGNIYISNSTDTIDSTSTLKEAQAALSITAQNEYAQIAPATIALQEAVKQLNSVKKEYEQYKNEKSNLQTKLNELKQRYKNKEVGINASDIEDLSDILDNIKDEERYYITNVALATTNVASKTTALISQIAAAASSSGTYGFSLGVAADISGSDTKSSSKQITSVASNLLANNINLSTNTHKDTSTNITGSNLKANNDIDINTKDLNINSSQDRFESDENSKALSGSAKFTMYGGGGGSLGLDHSQSNSYSKSITNNNSKLISNKDININTTNDATIKGANLRADGTLNLKVGNNLSLESLRDRYTSNQKDFSISAGVGFSGNTIAKSNGITTTGLFDKNHFVDINTIDKSSTNANFSRSRSNTITKQTILSSITANELNVEVGKNTHLKGSLLAAGEYDKDNTFIDNHNLNLKTNTLSYENLSNTSYNKGTNFSIGANYILEDKNNKYSKSNNNQEDKFTGLKSIDLSNHRNLSYTLSKNMATLGSGNIEIADKDNSDDLTRLNRDTTKLTKDLVNTSISSNVDASMDLRVLTADGREQIKSEIKYVINKLDDFNRFVKDKISDELTSEQKEQIEQVGLKNSILQALKKEGVSDEKINLLLNDENVRRLISDYENINNANTLKSNNDIILKGIEVIAQKDFQDYLVDGAEAINSMVKIVGEGKAATAILITQFATQGIVKTSVSMLMEEGKDTLFGGVKDKISNYISKDLFEVNDKGWQDKQKQAIYSLSDVSADFSIDLAISGPFALMKGAKNLGKANKKFDESLKENNVNSDTIANSNADLKSNDNTMIVTSKKKGGVIVSSNTLAKQGSSNLVGEFTKLEEVTVDEIISRVSKGWKVLVQKM
ncbi:hemagglutinin repeat-containing protein, partial [Campylobacter concisus]|uniref:hemagglutinin repeat-containing protein n=1 Tax=Campylobacter concisus TaxID=199 RepID=UPI001652E1F6